MKAALQKSPISAARTFIVKELNDLCFDPNWHFHPEYQLFVVLQGKGTRFVGDHVKSFKPGDVVFTGPNLPHLWRSDHEYFEDNDVHRVHGIVVYFQEDFLGEAMLGKEEMIKVKQLFAKARRGLEITGKTAATVSTMMQQLLATEGLRSIIQLLKILEVLVSTHESQVLASPGYTNSLKDGDTERMNRVHAYVMKHFRQKISLEEVSSLANMTPTSFSRYFKTHANKTFTDFVSEIRIGHACKLLIEENVNVSQACYDSGFQTLSNFNKQFKAITHRSPLQYKKEYAEALYGSTTPGR